MPTESEPLTIKATYSEEPVGGYVSAWKSSKKKEGMSGPAYLQTNQDSRKVEREEQRPTQSVITILILPPFVLL